MFFRLEKLPERQKASNASLQSAGHWHDWQWITRVGKVGCFFCYWRLDYESLSASGNPCCLARRSFRLSKCMDDVSALK